MDNRISVCVFLEREIYKFQMGMGSNEFNVHPLNPNISNKLMIYKINNHSIINLNNKKIASSLNYLFQF